MATCKYCNKSAGLFSHSHKECENRHSVGLSELRNKIKSYFAGLATTGDLRNSIVSLKATNFLTDDDICHLASEEIRNYTSSISPPFKPAQMHLVDDFVTALALPYAKINAKGAVDEFAKKLIRAFMVDYFTGKLALPEAQSRCESVLKRFPLSSLSLHDAYFHVLDRATSKFLSTGMITPAQQQLIDDYVNTLALPINHLPPKYRNSDISKLAQVTILNKISQGIVPTSQVAVPVVLGRNETVLWNYPAVTLYQEKITREWVGRSGGMSFRVMKGVYYRTGRMKGRPVEHSSMEYQGQGNLIITNKNLIFYSSARSAKVPFSKIIGLTPYSDGVEVHRDGTNQKRMTLQGFDPWFLMNLLSQINNI